MCCPLKDGLAPPPPRSLRSNPCPDFNAALSLLQVNTSGTRAVLQSTVPFAANQTDVVAGNLAVLHMTSGLQSTLSFSEDVIITSNQPLPNAVAIVKVEQVQSP